MAGLVPWVPWLTHARAAASTHHGTALPMSLACSCRSHPLAWSIYIPLPSNIPTRKHWCLCSPGRHWGLPAGTYRHRMQGIAQAELATGHHRLLGGPALAAHHAPLTASLHLHAALKRRPAAGEADLQGSPGAVSRDPSPSQHSPAHPGPCAHPGGSVVLAHAALVKLALAPTCKPWLANPRPSWRQATIASSVPQPSLQTSPQRS